MRPRGVCHPGRDPMAAVDYLLKIAGIDGESPHDKHKGEIDVESWSWGETQTASPVGGARGRGRKVSMNDFTFTMKLSKASPKLFLRAPRGSTSSRRGSPPTGRATSRSEYFLKWSFWTAHLLVPDRRVLRRGTDRQHLVQLLEDRGRVQGAEAGRDARGVDQGRLGPQEEREDLSVGARRRGPWLRRTS